MDEETTAVQMTTLLLTLNLICRLDFRQNWQDFELLQQVFDVDFGSDPGSMCRLDSRQD